MITPILMGAKGNGVADDTLAVQKALDTGDPHLHLPAGKYKITSPIIKRNMNQSLLVTGEGENVSKLVGQNTGVLDFSFLQDEFRHQPYGLVMQDMCLTASGAAGTAVKVSYDKPISTNDHYRPAVVMRNMRVESSQNGYWMNGIDLSDAWNPTLENVYVSGGSAGGKWNEMVGSGISLNRMCVNAHFTNVKTNFWATGIKVHAGDGPNTEGNFFSNCSMVGVKRGLWVKGNRNIVGAPRISTVNWNGGMIECRVGGVRNGSAAIHLEDVWTALITGAQFITETITDNVENTYGVCIQNCHGVVVNACDLNAWIYGVFTTDECRAINVSNNTFTNTPTQVVFNAGTTHSRSTGSVLVNNKSNEVNGHAVDPDDEESWATRNRMDS